jgi:hypothetical protein
MRSMTTLSGSVLTELTSKCVETAPSIVYARKVAGQGRPAANSADRATGLQVAQLPITIRSGVGYFVGELQPRLEQSRRGSPRQFGGVKAWKDVLAHLWRRSWVSIRE